MPNQPNNGPTCVTEKEPILENNRFLQTRFITLIALTLLVLLVGTSGYMLLEGWNWIDALYMTIITLTTVGFGETNPLSPAGQIFTIILITGGVGIFAYLSTTMVQILISGELRHQLEVNRRLKMLKRMENHHLVCGYGRMGRNVVEELEKRAMPFVIIDQSETVVERCRQAGYMSVHGNASNEDTLLKAGIERAHSLITTAPSDAENVFIVLTAREMRPDLVIVTRMNYDESESKLRRAGANEVISPYDIGGKRMVSYLERPGVVDFLDIVMHSADLELQLEEFTIASTSPLVGQSLQEAKLRTQTGVNIMAMRLPGASLSAHVDTTTPLKIGTRLIALGTSQQLEMLAQLTHTTSKGN